MDLGRKLPELLLGPIIVLFIAVLTWLFHLPISSSVTNQVISTAYYEDDTGLDGIAEVSSRPFTAFQGPLFLGNKQRPLWLKVEIAPAPSGQWVFLAQPNYTQSLELWQQASSGQWQSQVVGLNHPFAERQVRSLVPALAVTLSPNAATTVYVKVVSPTTPLFVRVISDEQNREFNSLIHMVLGVIVGIGLLVVVLSALLYLASREPLWAMDVLFNVLGLTIIVMHLGVASKIVVPATGAEMGKAVMVMNAIYTAYGAYFYSQIFQLFQVPKSLLGPFRGLLVTLPLLLLLIAFDQDAVAMQINNIFIFILSLLSFAVIARARHQDVVMRWAFRLGFGLATSAYFLAYAVPVFMRQQTGSMMALYPGMPITLFTVFMLMTILGRHTLLTMAENRSLHHAKRLAEQQRDTALQHHEETSSFLGLLLHEVKNPLSTIRMSMANLLFDLGRPTPSEQQRIQHVKEAAEAIDAVLERGLEIDQLVQAASNPEPQPLDVSAWLLQRVEKHEASARLQLINPMVVVASVDHRLVDMMLMNLIDNAVKYAAPDTPIVIELKATSEHCQFTISNVVGPVGFPDAALLFGKYYRSPQAMSVGGLGLGLYWVRGVARQLGGDLHYRAQHQRVIFTLCLPI